mmetsp:Transcript_11071/g.29301  ORF Transcript_11071/g.29301 Transcript_11071/m.29301 type:complete len:393 (-) Transcript_11071:1076-2254(-)
MTLFRLTCMARAIAADAREATSNAALPELVVPGEEVPERFALVGVAVPRQRADVQFVEIGFVKHLHRQRHAFGDALPGVVEDAPTQWHQENLAFLPCGGPLRGSAHGPEVLCHENSLRDLLMNHSRCRSSRVVQVRLHRHCRRVHEADPVCGAREFLLAWDEAIGQDSLHDERPDRVEVFHEDLDSPVGIRLRVWLRQFEVAVHEHEIDVGVFCLCQDLVDRVDAIRQPVGSRVVEHELSCRGVHRKLTAGTPGVVVLVILQLLDDAVVGRVLRSIELRGKDEVCTFVGWRLDLAHDLGVGYADDWQLLVGGGVEEARAERRRRGRVATEGPDVYIVLVRDLAGGDVELVSPSPDAILRRVELVLALDLGNEFLQRGLSRCIGRLRIASRGS